MFLPSKVIFPLNFLSIVSRKAIHREQQMIILLKKNTSCKPVQNVQTNV